MLLGAAWGAVYPLTTVALRDGLPPTWVVALRATGAAILLLPYAAATGALRPIARQPAMVVLCGLVQATIPLLLLTAAQQHVTAGVAGILSTLQPITAALLIAALTRTLHRRRWLAITVGAAGAALLAGPTGTGTQPLAAAGVLAAAVLFAVGAVLIGRTLPDIPASGIAAAAMVLTTVAVLPVAARCPVTGLTASAGVAVAALGVLTALPLALYYRLTQDIGADQAGLAWYLAPAAAILYDIPISGAPSLTELAGLALVISALALGRQ